MKRLMLKLVRKFLVHRLVRLLSSSDIRKKLARRINDKVDLPRLNEQQEQKIIDQLLNVMGDIFIELVGMV